MSRPAGVCAGPLAAIEYEPGLVEESVRRTIERGTPDIESLKLHRLRRDHRRQLDAVYELPEGERRESAFRDHFMEFFDELGIASWIPRWLEIFPQLRADLECVLVRAATGPGEEGAELWEHRAHRGEGIPAYLMVTVPAAGMGQPGELRALLLPDLLRAADAIDPDFGFRREDLSGTTRAAQERLRAAYQRLWELSARARLTSRGLIEEQQLLPELEAFVAEVRGAGEASRVAPLCVTDLLKALTTEVCHQRLLFLARQVAGGTSVHTGGAARCPLCRYPTSEWAIDGALGALGAAIRADFSDWSPSDGCCTHCAEHYELLSPNFSTGGVAPP